MARHSAEPTGMAADPSLLIGPVAFVLGMAAALFLTGWLGSVLSLAVLGVGAYLLLIAAMALGGLLAYAAATATLRTLFPRRPERHD